MSAVRQPARFELSAYLQFEESSSVRHEFVDGIIYAMVGGSHRHAVINANLMGRLHSRLAGKPCRPLGSDMRLFIREANMATYPDLAIYCGKPEMLPGRMDTLLNPTVVVEVLSPSTRQFDRGEKFDFYQRIPSLKQYVLVHQERPVVELFTRTVHGLWQPALLHGLEALLDLVSVGVQLPLADLFDGVEFDPPEPAPAV